MAIVDTHTHFYDPSRPDGVPWPKKTESKLYRTVLPAHFRAVAEPVGIRHTVVVEASDRLDDNRWILDMAASDESIVGHVGYVDLTSNVFSSRLAQFTPNPLFRGIRARGLPVRKLLEEQSNLSALAELDLALDLLARPTDLPAVAELARSIPSLRIVLDHVAHVPIDGGEPAADWSAGMRELSALRNVFCKVSGLTEAAVERPAPTDPAYYAPTLKVLFDELGADRLMYASNWPVCELASDYETGYHVVDSFLAARTATERELVEWKTAKAVYKYVGVNEGR